MHSDVIEWFKGHKITTNNEKIKSHFNGRTGLRSDYSDSFNDTSRTIPKDLKNLLTPF